MAEPTRQELAVACARQILTVCARRPVCDDVSVCVRVCARDWADFDCVNAAR